MLQTPLAIQIVIGITTLIVFTLGLHFYEKGEYGHRTKDKLFIMFSIVLFITTAIGVIYFFYNVITTTQFLELGDIIIPSIKLIIFIIIGIEILLYKMDIIDEMFFQVISVLTTTLIVFVILFLSFAIKEGNYESNIVKVNELKYSEEQVELVPGFNTQEIEGSVNNKIATDEYYNVVVYQLDDEYKEYEIFYIDNETNQKMYTKLYGDTTTIIPIEENETPYLLIKTYTSYCIDNNQDPPVECRFENKYEYELHVPIQVEEASN